MDGIVIFAILACFCCALCDPLRIYCKGSTASLLIYTVVLLLALIVSVIFMAPGLQV